MLELFIESVAGARETFTAGAACTCTVIGFVTVSPSPVTVTVNVADVIVAAEVALRVSVDEPLSAEFSETEAEVHEAVTPEGKVLLTFKLTAPL